VRGESDVRNSGKSGSQTLYEVSSAYTVSDQEIMTEAKNYFRWQYDIVEPYLGTRVVEIGCGIGNFTDLLKQRPLQILGLDIDENCIRAHNQRFGGLDRIEARQFDALGGDVREITPFAADTIVCLNVLEHISDDVGALRSMYSILQPGGKACLIVPAFEALRGPIDEHLGHYRRYTKRSLSQAATLAGFGVHEIRYMNIVGMAGWWLNARVLKREAQSKAQVALFDSLVVPILSRLEAIVAPPIGQNVFAVLEKPRS
jgi:SAM-dependent methyltransferase